MLSTTTSMYSPLQLTITMTVGLEDASRATLEPALREILRGALAQHRLTPSWPSSAPTPGAASQANPAQAANPAEPLLLRAREAAKCLQTSERTLWELTKQGQIKCVRLGKSVRYDRRDLLAWIDRCRQEPTSAVSKQRKSADLPGTSKGEQSRGDMEQS